MFGNDKEFEKMNAYVTARDAYRDTFKATRSQRQAENAAWGATQSIGGDFSEKNKATLAAVRDAGLRASFGDWN